jgi:hypothetical protein
LFWETKENIEVLPWWGKILLKSLKETLVSLGCRVHRNSMVKSLHPCSFNSQAFSHPTFLKTSSNSKSIPIV